MVKHLKPTTYCRLYQPAYVTNCNKSSYFSNTLVAFADDSALCTAGWTESHLCSDMIALFKRVIQWFDVNYLALTVGKSCFLIFSRISRACSGLNEVHLSRGSLNKPKDRCVRFLGILLDENLSFEYHIHLIKMKVSRSLGILKNCKTFFRIKFLESFWFNQYQFNSRIILIQHPGSAWCFILFYYLDVNFSLVTEATFKTKRLSLVWY